MDNTYLLFFKKLFLIPSILCTIPVIIMILAYKIKKYPSYINLLFLLLNDLLYFVSILLTFYNNELIDSLCITQGFLLNFSKQGSIIWNFFICYTCLIEIINPKYYIHNKFRFTIIFLFFSTLIPFFICLYLYIFNLYGNDIYYCSLSLNTKIKRIFIMNNQRVILFFEVFEYFLILYCYKKCKAFIFNIENKIKKKIKSNKEILYYPLIYLIISPIGIINKFKRLQSFLEISPFFEYLNLILEGLKGIFILLLFFTSPGLQINISKPFKKSKKKKYNKAIIDSLENFIEH